jgi:hypothetical protein
MITALQHPDDATWYFSVVLAWSSTEISAAIIALSLPAMRALFAILKKNRPTINRSGSDEPGSIGLRSIPRSVKRRIFKGSDVYETTAEVSSERTQSQEALWDVKGVHEISVMDTIRVDVNRGPSR